MMVARRSIIRAEIEERHSGGLSVRRVDCLIASSTSGFGTFRTCRSSRRMSVVEG
jgi:hypothetical protein